MNNLTALFISRPVATSLLALGVTLLGAVSFNLLPVSPLPQVDFPTISVSASLPGASPETMASSVASPLERALGIIPGVTEMTSSSSLGTTRVVLQFDLSRNIDGAARDVQAAINAASSLLPTGMPSLPTYRKINPADAPVLLIALTSDTYTRGQMYDIASTILAQKLAQVQGIGEVDVVGSSLPAVRVEVNPTALDKYGLSAETLRTTIAATNAYQPKGALENDEKNWQIYANDLARTAAEYRALIVAWNNGAPIRLSDIAEVKDSVQDIRNAGLTNGKPSVLIMLTRQPGANIIETVDRVRALMPLLHAEIPAGINMSVISDRTPTIRASLHEVERALVVSIALVIMVVFLFLRSARATLIPSVTVPVSLIATFGVMYLAGFSLDNLSLMALVIATGFVVDDAVVVLENVTHHVEEGMPMFEAALKGAREVSFTVVSMSLSLIAVFIPILFMGGIIGRLFREFAVTLSAAILVSLVVSLTLTPMMCARLLRKENKDKMPALEKKPSRILQLSERVFNAMLNGYQHSLGWALRHGRIVMLILAVTIAFNIYLYIAVPKGFFPQQDVGRMFGGIRGDQSISFQSMSDKLTQFVDIVRRDPAVQNVSGSAGSSGNAGGASARMFVTLKPLGSGDGERTDSMTEVMARIRKETSHVPGASLFLAPEQDIRIGGRQSNSQYQYTLQADSLADLNTWGPRVLQTLATVPEITDVDTDQQLTAPEIYMHVDRSTIARLGLTMNDIDSMLNDAFSQRQISTIYNPMNQYHVVMEVAEQYRQSPAALDRSYVVASDGTSIPIASVSQRDFATAPLSINHQGLFSASTISFNLAPGVTLSQASAAIKKATAALGMPVSVTGSFQGTAKAFEASLKSEPLLIMVAILTVYLVLGILYESYVHPLTILSTLPSAGIGALIGLWVFGSEFDIISLIGILLLIGIVKKNAIMMIDAALDFERNHGKTPEEAIYEACLRRFRPIMMTTMAAMLGALPLAVPKLLGGGEGAELRVPLGISVVCGLLLSQILTLYTTPVVYLYLDRFRLWAQRKRQSRQLRHAGNNAGSIHPPTAGAQGA